MTPTAARARIAPTEMKPQANTILVTGGSSGIGLALVERFVRAGNEVIVTGRRQGALQEVKKKIPAVHTIVSDAGSAKDREQLAQEIVRRFPAMNVLVNNAGIQRRVDLKVAEPWEATREEIAINVEGPIHLCALFLDHLRKQPDPLIANVSSGLAFVPLVAAPIYSATKAAMHSYTQSLRHQLRGTKVRVVEIIPPAVKSNLGGAHDFGVETDEYADSVMKQLEEGRDEVTYQFSEKTSQASRGELDEIFKRLNP